jgi:hypothetical protein
MSHQAPDGQRRTSTGSKKINSSHPFAASGERRKGTMTIIASRSAHSAAKKAFNQNF